MVGEQERREGGTYNPGDFGRRGEREVEEGAEAGRDVERRLAKWTEVEVGRGHVVLLL